MFLYWRGRKEGDLSSMWDQSTYYTSWLGEVERLKNRKLRYQESLKQETSLEDKRESLLKIKEQITEKEKELRRKEEEITKKQNEILKIKDELSKDKVPLRTKNALYASVIITCFGIILMFLSPILATAVIYNLVESIFKERALLLSTLVLGLGLILSTQVLGLGLIFIGSLGIILSLIFGYGKE